MSKFNGTPKHKLIVVLNFASLHDPVDIIDQLLAYLVLR